VSPWEPGKCTQSRRDGWASLKSLVLDGCPTFAQAYVGRKRWAKPNERFIPLRRRDLGNPISRSFFARCGIPQRPTRNFLSAASSAYLANLLQQTWV
jgi:hypothetical protein